MRALVAAVVAAVLLAGLVWLLLPPQPGRGADVAALEDPIRGAFHVHTHRSDGSGSIGDVAAAAARAGLDFVVITDHGDGTVPRESPTYVAGVLVIDAIEISGTGGHVVALELPTALYPLGGEVRDVVEDVRRMGGMAIVAHPASDRDGLRWDDWDLPVDGLEWINGDSQWRDEPLASLGRALLTYPVRRVGTLAALLDRPDDTLRQWDAMTSRRPVVGVAGGDAHARIGFALHVPSYEQVFRTMSIALPGAVLGGNAREDGRAVIDAIRGGRVYSTLDGLAGEGRLGFEAAAGETVVGSGGRLPAGAPVSITVDSNAPPGARVVLLGDGAVVAEADGASLQFVDPEGRARADRAEVHLAGDAGRAPWIVSNPIYVGPGPAGPARGPVAAQPGEPLAVLYGDDAVAAWRLEQSPRAGAALDEVPTVDGTQMLLRWALGGTISEGPFVALVHEAGPAAAEAARLRFTGSSDRPMRLSVQFRVTDGRRWHRSVFLDTSPRDVEVAVSDMRPRDPGVTGPVPVADVRDVLFVVDTVHAVPGGNGQVWLDEIRWLR
jgi:hypothetical protein